MTTKEQQRLWYARNRERVRIYRAAYYASNREKALAHRKKWHSNNKEKSKAYNAAWFAANPEKARLLAKKWRENNPGMKAVYQSKRRSRLSLKTGNHTDDQWKSLVEQYNHQCLRCGSRCCKLTRDHVIPIIKGGSNAIDNIQPLCGHCNSAKGDLSTDYRL